MGPRQTSGLAGGYDYAKKERVKMKYCPYCGADIPDGAVSFCAECGKALPAKQEKTKQSKPAKNRLQ